VFALLRSGAVIELAEVPPSLRWPLAALWLLGLANAFNLLDIMDGLAAGVGALASVALAVVAITTGQLQLAATSLALAGALCGFAVFNFHPARIYLGDAGSLAVGISLGAIALALRWSDRSRPASWRHWSSSRCRSPTPPTSVCCAPAPASRSGTAAPITFRSACGAPSADGYGRP